jgi:RimJ/RimL family protein N-acetyltransferase
MDELTTARLRLRSWSYEDADFLFDICRRWEVQRFIGLEPRVMADRTEAVASIERRRALNHPVHGIWAIERLTDQVLVGNCVARRTAAAVLPSHRRSSRHALIIEIPRGQRPALTTSDRWLA